MTGQRSRAALKALRAAVAEQRDPDRPPGRAIAGGGGWHLETKGPAPAAGGIAGEWLIHPSSGSLLPGSDAPPAPFRVVVREGRVYVSTRAPDATAWRAVGQVEIEQFTAGRQFGFARVLGFALWEARDVLEGKR